MALGAANSAQAHSRRTLYSADLACAGALLVCNGLHSVQQLDFDQRLTFTQYHSEMMNKNGPNMPLMMLAAKKSIVLPGPRDTRTGCQPFCQPHHLSRLTSRMP